VQIRKLGRFVLDKEDCDLDVSIAFVESDEIARLNREYLQSDSITDVIAFPLWEKGDPDRLLGEVVICPEKAVHEAQSLGISPEEELNRYVVHGLLHLLGYDDRDEEKAAIMEERQEKLLARFHDRP
jgi:probable rRNA maturation factor